MPNMIERRKKTFNMDHRTVFHYEYSNYIISIFMILSSYITVIVDTFHIRPIAKILQCIGYRGKNNTMSGLCIILCIESISGAKAEN